jgi:hypothetical protein
MDWTRSPWMRALALAASGALVVVHRAERGAWFWVGVALVILNVSGLLRARARAGRPDPLATGAPGADHRSPGGQSRRLDELLALPGVAAALAAGPRRWQQVSYLDDTRFEPASVEELAAFVWLENHEGWSIGLGDEVKPYLDLDLDEATDPVITVLRSHWAVSDAFHEDREVYRVEQRAPISTEEFAELAARALVSHHQYVAARA